MQGTLTKYVSTARRLSTNVKRWLRECQTLVARQPLALGQVNVFCYSEARKANTQ